MRQSRIFTDRALAESVTFELDARNNHYLIHVLRVKKGQALRVFNGSGREFNAHIEALTRKSVRILIAEEVNPTVTESPLNTTLGIAISKGDRMDWVIQKATELGVNIIQPLVTERVDVKLNAERREKKFAHWQATLINACEQSGRCVLPSLKPLKSIDEWLPNDKSDCKLILRAKADSFERVKSYFTAPPQSASVIIGPEGGLSPEEITVAVAQGYHPVGFGSRVLRTETAPIVALGILQASWGDF
tara:strand:+ start:33 stop:773 length:741 start_codon:yes stop_codon:yes gene_type:complete